jgi:hypothetical protein
MFGALPGGKIRYMDAMNGVKGLSEILGELSTRWLRCAPMPASLA